MYFRLGLAAFVLILVLGLVSTALWYRSEAIQAGAEAARIEKELQIAVEVNERNAETMKRLQAAEVAARKATEKELEAAQKRAASIKEISKEMENVPGANDPAGSYWDAFGDRLRQSQRNH